jgi:hypothetical protein
LINNAIFPRFFIVFAICVAKFNGENRPHFCLRYDYQEKKGGGMKEKFKLWLISLNCEGINSLGINEIVSRVDEELRIVRANEQERIVLEELIAEFKS